MIRMHGVWGLFASVLIPTALACSRSRAVPDPLVETDTDSTRDTEHGRLL